MSDVNISKDQLLQIIKEEIQKFDSELNKKVNMYAAKLRRLREKKSQEYLLNESDKGEEEQLAEMRMLDKVIEDLNNILYEER